MPVQEIRENKHDLSINRYKEVAYEERQHDPPQRILENLRLVEQEISKSLTELEELLR